MLADSCATTILLQNLSILAHEGVSEALRKEGSKPDDQRVNRLMLAWYGHVRMETKRNPMEASVVNRAAG
jgi:hypothetical protein